MSSFPSRPMTLQAWPFHVLNASIHFSRLGLWHCPSLKGWGFVKGVLSRFDLDVDSAEPTPVSRWSARSAARTNDLDDGAERFSACSVEVEEHRLCGCGATSPR